MQFEQATGMAVDEQIKRAMLMARSPPEIATHL